MGDEPTQYFVQGDTEGEYVEAQLPDPPTFKEMLADDLRENESLQNFESVSDLANAHVGLLSQQPTIPENADAYEFSAPEGFPLDDARLGSFKQVAHEHKLTQSQFEALANRYVDDYLTSVKDLNESIAANRDAALATLKKDWGDKFDENLEAAKGFKNSLGKLIGNGELSEEFSKWGEDTRFFDDPVVIKIMHALSAVVSEARMRTGDQRGEDNIKRGADGRVILPFKPMD